METAAKHSVMLRIVTELERNRIQKHTLGYIYLREAIYLLYCNYALVRAITGIYKTVASESGTTGSRVERAIRHAIEIAFGASGEPKPVNSHFIANIADKLRLEDGLI